MKTPVPLLVLLLSSPLLLASRPAEAGTLRVEKKGLMPALVWIDGTSKGKVKKKKPLQMQVTDGPHEVWVAIEAGGTVTRCHGLVDVSGDTTVGISDMGGCTNLRRGFGGVGATAFRGSSVDFNITGVDAWVQVDGGQPLALPALPFVLNLDPGTHTIILWNDNFQTSVYDQGTVTLGPGQRLPVTCTPAGCLGFDAAPQVIQILAVPGAVVHTPPAGAGVSIGVDIPGVSVGVGVSPDGTLLGGSIRLDATGIGGAVVGEASSASTTSSCCIDGAFYSCPDPEAVYQCSGAFMACMTDCGMTDASCPERCLASHPFDPSRCSRVATSDATCTP